MLQCYPSRSSKKYVNSERHVLPHISVSKRSFEIRPFIRLMKSCCLPRPKNPRSLSVLSAKWWLKNSPNFEFRKYLQKSRKSCFKRRLKRRLPEPRVYKCLWNTENGWTVRKRAVLLKFNRGDAAIYTLMCQVHLQCKHTRDYLSSLKCLDYCV